MENNEWVLWLCLAMFAFVIGFISYILISLTLENPKSPNKGELSES